MAKNLKPAVYPVTPKSAFFPFIVRAYMEMAVQGDRDRLAEFDADYIRSNMERTLRYQSALFAALVFERSPVGAAISFGLDDMIRNGQRDSLVVSDGLWRVAESVGEENVSTVNYGTLVFVEEKKRGRGWGHMIMQYLIDSARERGFSYFSYSTLNPVVVHIGSQLLGPPLFKHPDHTGMDIYVHRL